MKLHFKNIKILFFFLIFFLIVVKFFNTSYNSYSILLWDYNKRMTQEYGFCKNESWGFYNYVINKYNLQNKKINIINDEGFVKIHSLFKDVEITDKNYRYLMILNFQSNNKEDIYNAKINNIDDFSVKYRFNNCYLLELND
jgi:hypothetical protein|tara:strand:+ start:391 stop:813 length:423 start_codon:yes stop_codon:yes gene_type:complete